MVAGVSRCRLRSGRWTITLRSLPTSEWTPYAAISSRSLFTAWPIPQRRLGNS